MKTKFRTLCLTMGMVAVLAAGGTVVRLRTVMISHQANQRKPPAASAACSPANRSMPSCRATMAAARIPAWQRCTENIETEQCRYVHFEDADMQYLDVFVYRASSDAGFKKVDISGRMLMGSPQKARYRRYQLFG